MCLPPAQYKYRLPISGDFGNFGPVTMPHFTSISTTLHDGFLMLPCQQFGMQGIYSLGNEDLILYMFLQIFIQYLRKKERIFIQRNMVSKKNMREYIWGKREFKENSLGISKFGYHLDMYFCKAQNISLLENLIKSRSCCDAM